MAPTIAPDPATHESELAEDWQPSPPPPLPYELRIGVTGHRELQSPQKVEAAVRDFLGHVVQVLETAAAEPFGPHGNPESDVGRLERLDRLVTGALSAVTRALGGVVPRVPRAVRRPSDQQKTPLKLTVVSSLASGADQIVARVVCDLVRDPERRNRYVEAVLPFAPELYEGTFDNDGDLNAFRHFLKLDCGQLNTHPDPTVLFPNQIDPRNPVHPVSPAHAYAAAGRYVVDASEILVAVWDPSRPQNAGGTRDTVRYAIGRGRVVLWLNPARLDDGAFLLRASDSAAISSEPPPEHIQRLFPDGIRAERLPSRAKQLSLNFHRLAAYNRDALVDHGQLIQDMGAIVQQVLGIARECYLPAPATRMLVTELVPHVVRADHLSVRYRRLRDFSANVWPTLAAIVVSLMAFQIIFLPSQFWLAAVELIVLLLGYLSYRVSRYDAWHEKWLHDRRLAEGLRSAMFVALIRSKDEDLERERLESATRGFVRVREPLPFYSPASTWFVATLKRVLGKKRRDFARIIDLDDISLRTAVAAFIKRAWILDQADYHEQKAHSREKTLRRTERIQLSIIACLAVVAVLHAMGIGHGSESSWPFTRIDLWIAFATVALPAWAGAVHVMSSLHDHRRLAERSSLMSSLLRGLADQLGNVENIDDLRDTVTEAERILDLESAEWAESLMDRRPEFTG